MYELQQPQICVMNQLKEQLEERTRILQADIKTQQQELHDIKEKLHFANLQVTLPQRHEKKNNSEVIMKTRDQKCCFVHKENT